MKKIIALILIPIILLGFILFALFTPMGSNAIVKPIVNAKIENKIKKPKIEIVKLDSKYHYINSDIIIQNSVMANIVGSIYYFKKSFDLNYKIKAKSVKLDNEVYKLNLDILGKIKGNIKNIFVNGYGKAFDSTLEYQFNVKNSVIKSIIAKIQDAKISQILLLAKQPPYADGLLSLQANMPSLDIQNPRGEALLTIDKGKFNRRLIYKKYKIVLPKDESFDANIYAKVYHKKIFAKGDFNTTTIKFKLKKLISTLDFNIAKKYFTIYIKDLSRLNTITKQKMQGSLTLDGVAYINRKKNIYQALVKTQSFGGLTKINYNTKTIKVDLNSVNITKVEKKLGQPRYVTNGNISGVVLVKNLKNYSSDFNIKSNLSINKKLLKIILPSYRYNIKTIASYKDLALKSKETIINSNYMNLLLNNLKYSIVSKRLSSSFNLDLNNLSLLKPLTKMPLRGKISLNGKVKLKGNNIDLRALTKSLGGVVNIDYKGDLALVKFKNISTPKILYILNQPNILKTGFATGSVDIKSISNLKGSINLKTNALINNKVLQKVYKINLGKDWAVYVRTDNAKLNKNRFYSDIIIKSKGINFNLNDLVYNLKNQSFKSKYILNVNDLSYLNTLTKQNLKGSLKVTGEIAKNGKYLLASGNSSKFDGTINFLLKGDNFTLNGAGLSIIQILDMLNKPKNLDGIAKVDLKYNLKSKIGNFNIVVDDAKFLNSKLVDNLKQYANFDLSKEVFTKAYVDGTINNNIIIFNLKTNSNKVKIRVNSGKIDIKENTIYAKVRVHLNGNDYNFIVKGPLDNPHYAISFSGVVKKKVKEKVESFIKKKGLDKKIEKIIPKDEIKKIVPDDLKNKAKSLLKGLL